MRWFWRLLTFLVLLGLVRTLFIPQSRAFIAWPQGQNWPQRINWEMKRWQRLTQDLPASLEVEVRRLWRDFQSNGDGWSV